jgi:transmembrane 9 superfamily member 1
VGAQTVQFFGYTLLVCYIFFLMLGTVGFLSSLSFVRYIYRNLKLD